MKGRKNYSSRSRQRLPKGDLGMADPWRTVTFFVFLESLLPKLGETFKSAARGGRCEWVLNVGEG